jgi:hypothetical protein
MSELGLPSLDVGVCLAGLQRTLLALPVRTQYAMHLVNPHRARGQTVATFVTVVGRWGARSGNRSAVTRSAVARAYNPQKTSFLEESDLVDAPGQRCSFKVTASNLTDTPHLAAALARASPRQDPEYMDPYKSAIQWIALRVCYADIEAHEARRGMRFSLLYRVRTDVVLLADTPLAAGFSEVIAAGAVYVPAGGLSPLDHFVCGNDQMFACPRALCRPYFELLELWQSAHCVPAKRRQVGRI